MITFNLSDEEIQKQREKNRLENLREAGELEANPEDLDTVKNADKPRYIQHDSYEDAISHQETVSKIMREGLYIPSSQDSEKRDGVFDNTADAAEAFINQERSKSLENHKNGEIKAVIGGETEKKPNFEEKISEVVESVFLKDEEKRADTYTPIEKTKSEVKDNNLVDFPFFFDFIKERASALLPKIDFKGIFEFGKGLFELFSGKKAKGEVLTPEQQAEKKKKAEQAANQKKFYDALAAQGGARPSIEFQQAEKQEKEQINTIGKIGQALYGGIKDSFGRLTIYARSLFERGQKDAELAKKKAEKQASLQQATKESEAARNARSLDKVDGQSGIVGANASAG